MPQLDGSVFEAGSFFYGVFLILVIAGILIGELSLVKHLLTFKNFSSFKKLNILSSWIYSKCY